jgi:hypothetical protein
MKNVTNLFLYFLKMKMFSLSVISHNVAVYKNVYTTLNEDLLQKVACHLLLLCEMLAVGNQFPCHSSILPLKMRRDTYF